jgi:hypothetical protein
MGGGGEGNEREKTKKIKVVKELLRCLQVYRKFKLSNLIHPHLIIWIYYLFICLINL